MSYSVVCDLKPCNAANISMCFQYGFNEAEVWTPSCLLIIYWPHLNCQHCYGYYNLILGSQIHIMDALLLISDQ